MPDSHPDARPTGVHALSAAGTRKELAVAGLVLATIVLGGSGALMWIEDWDFSRALFFVLITITTVGYGDQGLSGAGRLFTIPILIGGISAASYSFAVLFQHLMTDRPLWRKRMLRTLEKLEAHTIVCGYGRIGSTLCEELRAVGAALVVVDNRVDAVEAALADGHLALRGCASEDEVLERAGIARARAVVSAVDSPSENIVITLTARQLRKDLTIIARAERDEEFRKLRHAGADHVVSPFRSGGIEIAHCVTHPGLSSYGRLAAHERTGFPLLELRVAPGAPLDDSSLLHSAPRLAERIVLVALLRRSGAVELGPARDRKLAAGDELVVAAHAADLGALHELAGMEPAPDADTAQAPRAS